MRQRLALLAAAAVGALAVAASPAAAITGNYEKDFVHDYVGLLVFYTTPDPTTGDPFSHRCSGTLISPTVVVTAGHCTEGVDEGRVYFQQAAAPNYDPNAFGGWGGDPTTGYPYQNGVTFSRADNFGFGNFEDYPENRDAGVVVLDSPYTPPSGQFGILPGVGAVDAYVAANAKQDTRFRSSGYGVSDQDPRPVSFRERLMAWGWLVENASRVTPYNLKTTANPAQGKGGSCSGDSGGPVFFEGTRTIAAVVSFGMNGQCKGLDFSYRLDRAEILSWIADPNRPDAG
jgi:hypothetical protein